MNVSNTNNSPIKLPDFRTIWPKIDAIGGFLVPGQERWLFTAAANLPDNAVIVEIGSFMGRSTTAMAFACRGTDKKIFAIDMFKGNDSDFVVKGKNNIDWDGGDFLQAFKDNLAKNDLLDLVTPCQGLSGEIGKTWTTPIDFLFVDGSHEYDDVVRDFELFWPWLKPGGLIAFRDVQPQCEGPWKAWQDVIRYRLDSPAHFFSIGYGHKFFDDKAYDGTVHAIIPVHNRKNLTLSCLKSLRGQTIADRVKVHVVDDGSTDGTAVMLKNDFPEVEIIKGDGTLWWTGAVAKALETLQGSFNAGDYFVLVNNDVVLSPESIEVLVRESERFGRAAIGPIAINGDDAISTGWGPGTALELNNFERQFSYMRQQGQSLPVQALFGRCSLYPVEILDVVNNFDAEAFPHYHGDTDFGLRARQHGFPIYVTGRTCIRVQQNKLSTGSHHGFRQTAQSLRKVKENMTSIKSIDNVAVIWRYNCRHYAASRYRNTIATVWLSLRQWTPIFKLREMRGASSKLGLKGYAKRCLYYSVRPVPAAEKSISLYKRRKAKRSG